MDEQTSSESTSYSKSLLINEAYELAEKLGLIVKSDGLNFEVCSPTGENCAPLMEWYDSVLALGDCEGRYISNLQLVQDYGFRQIQDVTCWAATAAIAWAIRLRQRIQNEMHFFWNDMNYVIPHESHLRQYCSLLSGAKNHAGFSEDQLHTALLYLPNSDNISERASWLGNIDKDMYLHFLTWVKANLVGDEDQRNLLMVKLQIYITLFTDVVEVFHDEDRPMGLPRLVPEEIRFYKDIGFSVEEIPFDAFTPDKLKSLVYGGKRMITQLNMDALMINGKDIGYMANYYNSLTLDQLDNYSSHAVIVLDYNPITEEVFILNTLPIEGGSARIPSYVTSNLQTPGKNDAQLCVMNFYHFKMALISDIQILTKRYMIKGVPFSENATTTIRVISTNQLPSFYSPQAPQGGN